MHGYSYFYVVLLELLKLEVRIVLKRIIYVDLSTTRTSTSTCTPIEVDVLEVARVSN